MRSEDLRASFVEYFTGQGHKHVPSASLVPDAMSSTLFTIAGMEPFVPAFLGESPAPAPRAVSVQRCLRVAGAKSDIENVGRTGRHGTFLEMLGNFSFGDYYKREAIEFAWAFVTDRMRLDPQRLYVTVHTSDDEAQSLWEREIGMPSWRISRFDDDNFWTMGPTGPCGPCSELFYDIGAEHASSSEDTGPNRGNRYVEIWNLVFQQFNRAADGTLTELPRKAIDTGAGLERMLAVANGHASMYETDLFTDLIAAQPDIGTTSLAAAEQLVRRRIIADHARAVTFLIADGVYPSNTDRGYVLRFLIRRAIRNGRLLGYPREFMPQLSASVAQSLAPGYPMLRSRLGDVQNALRLEEANFMRTLDRGIDVLGRLVEEAIADCTMLVSGHDAFVLHDTYGFPVELTREIASERGVVVDTIAFEASMDEQRRRARADAASKRGVVTVADLPATRSVFHGYGGLEADGEVVLILRDGTPVDELIAGEEAQVVLDATSFYAEKGGQIGDRGTIVAGEAVFAVTDTQFVGEAVAHHGRLERGVLRRNEHAQTTVDPRWREEIRRHHTSAHLLQRALKEIVSNDVSQAGSWVGIDRMRFDFRSPTGALTAEQKRAVVSRVNTLIREDHSLETEELSIEEAERTGAISMAGEKYGDVVRVVRAGPSVEFCGGTHAHSTGELGLFVMLSESSIGSGIRRIEAVVSAAAEAYVERSQELIAELSESLSTKPEDLLDRVARLQADMREMQRSFAELKARMASQEAHEYVGRAETIGERVLVAATVPEANGEALRGLSNAIRSRLRNGVIALIGVDGGSASVIVSVSDDLVKSGVHAGNLVRAAVVHLDGKGGGAPAQAQGGGKNVAGVTAALDAIREALAA